MPLLVSGVSAPGEQSNHSSLLEGPWGLMSSSDKGLGTYPWNEAEGTTCGSEGGTAGERFM